MKRSVRRMLGLISLEEMKEYRTRINRRIDFQDETLDTILRHISVGKIYEPRLYQMFDIYTVIENHHFYDGEIKEINKTFNLKIKTFSETYPDLVSG